MCFNDKVWTGKMEKILDNHMLYLQQHGYFMACDAIFDGEQWILISALLTNLVLLSADLNTKAKTG